MSRTCLLVGSLNLDQSPSKVAKSNAGKTDKTAALEERNCPGPAGYGNSSTVTNAPGLSPGTQYRCEA